MDSRDNDKLKQYEKRPCEHCNKYKTYEGHDGCLDELIGLANACCGHGDVSEAYVQFYDGTIVNGKEAIAIQEILKRNKNDSTNKEKYKFLKGSIKYQKEAWNL